MAMEEKIIQHGHEKLDLLLTEINTILIVIIVVTALIFIPLGKKRKPIMDLRIITALCGVFWCVVTALIYPNLYWNRERIGWFLVDIMAAVAIIHFRKVFLCWRSRKRCD